MRCERCGREISNTELWRIAADPNAPATWSMRILCWDCREHPPTPVSAQAETTDTSAVASPRPAAEPAVPEAAARDSKLAIEAAAHATPPPA